MARGAPLGRLRLRWSRLADPSLYPPSQPQHVACPERAGLGSLR